MIKSDRIQEERNHQIIRRSLVTFPLTWLNGAGCIESRQDLRHTAMRDLQLSRNVARTNVAQCQLDDALPDGEGKRSAVDEPSAQLVDARLAYDHFKRETRRWV